MSITNIDLNDKFVKEGIKLTGFHTKKQLVNFALEELIKRKKKKDILELMGTRCWKGNLDKMRRNRT